MELVRKLVERSEYGLNGFSRPGDGVCCLGMIVEMLERGRH